MTESLLFDAFDWLELTPIGTVVRDSVWLFPVIEAVHLLGLAALGGSVLVVDLRLLGFGFTSKPVAYVLEQASPWLLASIALMFATGVPLFLSEAVKCYFIPAFWVKMSALSLALAFTYGVRNPMLRAHPEPSRWRLASIATCSLALWLTVAAAGRWIGFS